MNMSSHSVRRIAFGRLVALPALITLACTGCGKAERYKVESAITSSIYQDRSFFDQVCGFELAPSPQAKVEIVEAEGDALPWLGVVEGSPVPGTATIRITNVVKKGEANSQTCQAKIAFVWKVEKQPVTNRRHKVGETSDFYMAQGFKKL